MEMVINFGADGTVDAMHRDEFPLGFLGVQKIERASDIRFNEETQLWDLYVAHEGDFTLPIGGEGFAGYDEARRIEVKWLDHCRLNHLPVMGLDASLALTVIRRAP